MDSQENIHEISQGLPEPEDDGGACDHLPGRNAEELVRWLSERTAS
jgi:hypothetical protein